MSILRTAGFGSGAEPQPPTQTTKRPTCENPEKSAAMSGARTTLLHCSLAVPGAPMVSRIYFLASAIKDCYR